MRMLISIILTSFFFIASPNSEAAGKPEFKSDLTFAGEIIAQEINSNSEFADAGSIVFPQLGLRTSSSQYRTVHGTHPDHFGLPSLAYEVISQADRPTKSFSHCVPIGLKLLFPKHYFW